MLIPSDTNQTSKLGKQGLRFPSRPYLCMPEEGTVDGLGQPALHLPLL